MGGARVAVWRESRQGPPTTKAFQQFLLAWGSSTEWREGFGVLYSGSTLALPEHSGATDSSSIPGWGRCVPPLSAVHAHTHCTRAFATEYKRTAVSEGRRGLRAIGLGRRNAKALL